jgi:predicted Zn-dependent protease with MMP-like domain
MTLRPGKGFRVQLNDVLAFTQETLDLIERKVEEFGAEPNTHELFAALVAEGWEQDNNKFGDGVFQDVQMSNGEFFRISVVISKPSGEYRLDVRTWYDA